MVQKSNSRTLFPEQLLIDFGMLIQLCIPEKNSICHDALFYL